MHTPAHSQDIQFPYEINGFSATVLINGRSKNGYLMTVSKKVAEPQWDYELCDTIT
jgi:hypothetical protein